MWRDRDPPPNFDGDVEGFNQYVRDLKLWRHDTDVPERKHGVKVLRGLSGQAKAICNELSVEELTSTGSVDLILAKLREHYSPHLETTMPKAFEKAVYGEPRKPKESICDFVIRQDAAFRELHEEGVQLSDEVKGYILYRQSNLTQVQEDQITTWTQGKFARSDVVKALRKLEKIQKEKPGSRYMTVEDETFMTEPIEGGSDDSGDYVYLGEDDLNHIYEEEEIQEALATYQQVRKAIQEQKNNRGYYGPGVSGKGLGKSSKGKTSIKFSSKGTKVHVDLLKLRTKCARCGQVGHWAKECINEPDARAKNRAAASSTGTSSPKAGFFEVGEHTTMNVNDTYQVTLGQFIKKGQNRSSFVGLTTSSHVGDLFGMGNEEFFEVMEVLRGRFQFGKFVFLQEQVSGAAFNGRRLKQLPNGEIQVDMEKFVKEKLEEVKLDSGRASQPKSKADSEEKDRTRAAVGSLTWAAKEGRPDAAAMASLVASCLNDLKIQDILDLNKAIRNVRKEASLCIRIQPIAPEDIAWGVFTDASYANASKGRSQGAFAVVALDKKTLTEGKGKCNLLHWRSGKIHRVVNSTLAAETQALSRGMSELSWTVTVYNEFSRPDFNMKEWEKHLKDRSLQALVSQESTEELKRGIKNVGIVDAKSLYDHLSKEGIGATSDKRTALEMQVIRQTLAETGSEVRWIPHPKMVVDCLTKREGNSSPLYELLQSGQLNLWVLLYALAAPEAAGPAQPPSYQEMAAASWEQTRSKEWSDRREFTKDLRSVSEEPAHFDPSNEAELPDGEAPGGAGLADADVSCPKFPEMLEESSEAHGKHQRPKTAACWSPLKTPEPARQDRPTWTSVLIRA
eukprot:g447.t1